MGEMLLHYVTTPPARPKRSYKTVVSSEREELMENSYHCVWKEGYKPGWLSAERSHRAGTTGIRGEKAST